MWAKLAALAVLIFTLGIKARRQAAREKAEREQDELVQLRAKLERLTREKRRGSNGTFSAI